MLGNADPLVSVPGEILIANESEWYDFAAKYDEGGMDLAAPADLPDAVSADLQDTAAAGVRAVRLRRHGPDRLLRDRRRPGGAERDQHDPRLHVDLACTRGCSRRPASPYRELLDRLIELALERHADEQRYER